MPSRVDRLPEHIRRLGKVHHVALIVRSIDEASRFWRDILGLELEEVMDIPQDRVRIAFLAVGESKVELVEPTEQVGGIVLNCSKEELEALPPVVETRMTADNNHRKLPAAECARQVVAAMAAGRDEANVGMTRLLRVAYSISPALAGRIMLNY